LKDIKNKYDTFTEVELEKINNFLKNPNFDVSRLEKELNMDENLLKFCEEIKNFNMNFR